MQMRTKSKTTQSAAIADQAGLDDAALLERAFVELVGERLEAHGWKKIDFAARIWPESSRKAASSKWNDIFSRASKTGKPQGLRLSEAQRIAQILGEDLVYLIAVANERNKKTRADLHGR